MPLATNSAGNEVEAIPVREVAGLATTDAGGRTVPVMLVRYVDGASADASGRAVDAIPVTAVDGLLSTDSLGRGVDVAPVRTVAGLLAMDASGHIVPVTPVISIDGAGATPDWLPAGALGGVSYEDGEAYWRSNGELITDLSTIHTNLDPAAVTASGMAVLTGNGNRPFAAGALLDQFLQDFLVVCEISNPLADFTTPGTEYREFLAISEGPWLDADNYFDSAINNSASYPLGGVAAAISTGDTPASQSSVINSGANKVALQVLFGIGTTCAANGVGPSANDGNAKPDPTPYDTVQIGWYDGDTYVSDLYWKKLIFYVPDKTDPEVLAISA